MSSLVCRVRTSLTRAQRIRGRHQITRLFQPSSKKNSCVGMVLKVHPNRLPYNRVLIAPVRSVGNAVTRNRVKRWLRHDYAALQPRLRQGYDMALLVYPVREGTSHLQLGEKLLGLLQRAKLLQQATNGAEARS